MVVVLVAGRDPVEGVVVGVMMVVVAVGEGGQEEEIGKVVFGGGAPLAAGG